MGDLVQRLPHPPRLLARGGQAAHALGVVVLDARADASVVHHELLQRVSRLVHHGNLGRALAKKMIAGMNSRQAATKPTANPIQNIRAPPSSRAAGWASPASHTCSARTATPRAASCCRPSS